MKVIYLHQYFRSPSMSGGTRSYEMARRLVQAGHEVHLITSWQEKTDKKDWYVEEIEGINVHWLPVRYSNHMSFSKRIRAFFRFAFMSARRAIKVGGDVVFATSTPLTIAIPGVMAAKVLKAPLVFEVRDLWPELPIAIGALRNPVSIFLAKRLEYFAYKRSDRIIALSPGMAEGVTNAGFPAERLHVIPNSSDVDLFGPEKRDVEEDIFYKLLGRAFERVILYPGTLGHINDVGYLVDLAFESKKIGRDVAFVVIGDGVQKSSIEKKASSVGVLGHNFFMFPPMSKHRIVSALAEADMVISLFLPLKQMEANSANKFFDALASATPVAINYKGWQKDIIDKAGCGIILDRDFAASAKALIAYLYNEKNLKFAAGSAYQLAVTSFNRDILAKDFENVLMKAVDSWRKI